VLHFLIVILSVFCIIVMLSVIMLIVIMLIVIILCCYAECQCAEFRYAKFYCAECGGSVQLAVVVFSKLRKLILWLQFRSSCLNYLKITLKCFNHS
jgi:hypothetical protein